MIAPAVQRLVRDASTPTLPASLTVQERRTLMLVSAGFSNVEIAQRMHVATCTVRKHLEHAYPKLGRHESAGGRGRTARRDAPAL